MVFRLWEKVTEFVNVTGQLTSYGVTIQIVCLSNFLID